MAKALHHPIRARRVGPRRAMRHTQRLTGSLKAVGCKAGTAVGQHMGDPEGEVLDGLLEKGDRAALGLIVLDRQVDEAGGAVDGDIEVPLAALAIWCAAWAGASRPRARSQDRSL